MPVTPMMQQYLDIKKEYKEYILFYRLGDFYEMFFEDAKLVAKELELTLTGKDCGLEERAPMCGVPYHSVEPYIGKLVSKGYKIAICEQMEDPATVKGLVHREVVRIITPGTVTESSFLDDTQNNYIASVYAEQGAAAIAFSDISVGLMSVKTISDADIETGIINAFASCLPKEIIVNGKLADLPQVEAYVNERLCCVVNNEQTARFEEERCREYCRKQFSNVDPSELPVAAVRATGALIDYILETQKTDISYIDTLNVDSGEEYLQIDISTRRNLELCETMRGKEKKGSLLWVLDDTKTSGGARMLRKWVQEPLVNLREIQKRQSAVAFFVSDFAIREDLAALLKDVLDLERLATKVVYNTANGRDLLAIAKTAGQIPKIKALIQSSSADAVSEICAEIDELADLYELIETSVSPDAPFSIREGGVIKDGYFDDLDYLRDVLRDGKKWINQIEQNEREQTGIKTLKVSYNRIFGYYIEVTKSNLADVPARYIRKQTLANSERYITEELKELESTILGANDRIVKLEYELFCCIRDHLKENVARIKDTAAKLSRLDAMLSLALCAVKYNYICPEVDLSDGIDIKDGRHPVVERYLKDGVFVPNDTALDTSLHRMMLITGPNMAGKSTYMRQVALIVILAQIGSFVPASGARIGIVDKIFTRVGASDDLASGQSTFMLEMCEVAYILRNATRKSLIVYDEIGRGTSTFDGMSIARAIAEYSAGKKLGAKTLFATHYHELTDLEKKIEGIFNYNIAAKKKGDDITFLRKIVRGAADDSYGIEVAKLAGVPNEVIRRAKEILAHTEENQPKLDKSKKVEEIEDLNISLDVIANDEIREKLESMDLNLMTPIEAFDALRRLKELL